MSDSIFIIQSGLAEGRRKSRLPGLLDIMQSASGLVLALFMWGHMFFVASILLPQGETIMWIVTRFFEGYFFFGRSIHWLVSCVAAFVALVFVTHALLAVRKFPAGYRQFRAIRSHTRAMRHEDSTLWIWQVYTGFLLFFLASAHLYQMMIWPQNIGPYASSDRVWSDGLWPFYLAMLLAVELHAGIGLYRLAVKWDLLPASRVFLKRLKWALTAFFLILGLATLGAYMKIGYEHRYQVGERYTPETLPDWLLRLAPAEDFQELRRMRTIPAEEAR
ncbi:MAG: fumarate reductase cytochrome b subunit [Betaproteobacteria bacterium]|nr:fumarate reductase cytochrome b subunit [Betaproteobacteria bacterium]